MARTIGYARVSTKTQDVAEQTAALMAAGCGTVRQETASAARGKALPVLAALVDDLQPGDMLMVVALDRLGRSIGRILTLLDDLRGRGVTVRALKQGGLTIAPDSNDPMALALVHLLALFADLERATIAQRLADGRAYAALQGRHPGRKSVDPAKVEAAADLIRAGRPLQQAALAVGIGRTTLYDALDRLGLDPALLREQSGNLQPVT
jgi:DNA invertase Pin-like site-specific DNA recombinase